MSGPITGICLFLNPFSQNLLAFNDVIFPAICELLSLLCFSQLCDSEMWAGLVKSKMPMLERWVRCQKKPPKTQQKQKENQPHPYFANICAKEEVDLLLMCLPFAEFIVRMPVDGFPGRKTGV